MPGGHRYIPSLPSGSVVVLEAVKMDFHPLSAILKEMVSALSALTSPLPTPLGWFVLYWKNDVVAYSAWWYYPGHQNQYRHSTLS